MATDRLNIPVECPVCEEPIELPTSSRYEPGQQVVTVRLDNSSATFTPRAP